ncbi:unnamed protein product [Amoebophrya sp. A25]|nr:unnamed protein product [Amoebophrya sp. A25]|eukprot:GSA25T00027593001.1
MGACDDRGKRAPPPGLSSRGVGGSQKGSSLSRGASSFSAYSAGDYIKGSSLRTMQNRGGPPVGPSSSSSRHRRDDERSDRDLQEKMRSFFDRLGDGDVDLISSSVKSAAQLSRGKTGDRSERGRKASEVTTATLSTTISASVSASVSTHRYGSSR